MYKYIFIGDCQKILDDKTLENFGITDATELSQAINEYEDYEKPDGVVDITLDEFIEKCDVKSHHTGKHFQYGKNIKLNLYWSYNTETAIHYFYA